MRVVPRSLARGRRVHAFASAVAAALVVLLALIVSACGETRSPIGDECLRGDDCLSGVCSARTCVAAPTLVVGAGPPPPDEVPRIPVVEGGTADASTEGG
jgi:hypothetical protein